MFVPKLLLATTHVRDRYGEWLAQTVAVLTSSLEKESLKEDLPLRVRRLCGLPPWISSSTPSYSASLKVSEPEIAG